MTISDPARLLISKLSFTSTSVALSLLFLGEGHAAATAFWDGGGDNLRWEDPLNWNGDVLPGPTDTVDLLTSEISISSDQSVGTVFFAPEVSHSSGRFTAMSFTNNSFGFGSNYMMSGDAEIFSAGDIESFGDSSLSLTDSSKITAGGRFTIGIDGATGLYSVSLDDDAALITGELKWDHWEATPFWNSKATRPSLPNDLDDSSR